MSVNVALEYLLVSLSKSVLVNTFNSQNFILICLEDINKNLFCYSLLNRWCIAFLKTGFFVHLFICSKLSRYKNIYDRVHFCNKVASCYFTNYKLHQRCLMLNFLKFWYWRAEELSAFYPIIHETFSNSCVILLMYLGL